MSVIGPTDGSLMEGFSVNDKVLAIFLQFFHHQI